VEPEVRSAIVLVGLLFVFLFGGSAIVVIGQDGLDVLTVLSLLIAGMIFMGVLAVIRNPPKE
jgi:uncharacterized membrane protein